ncbi:polysaccharide deacetylase family protein, partial [bacterium]|nr:polysaccharide deacetylase family protein [bacterium]
NPQGAIADRLPILMYHSVADDGPAHLAPWRVTPALFEEQLRTFRDRGYVSVTLEQWRAARDRREQLRGRPLLLTFDDGATDFAEHAWPLLRKYGFGAIVYLVAERIGGKNDWDDCAGHDLPLMDWSTILRLQDEGVEFGSHTCTHAPLAALSPGDVVREGLRARHLLETGLGRPVRSIAYPFGDTDSVVAHLMAGCGYRFGLTCRSDISRYSDPLLELPRFHVDPAVPLDELLRRMELRHVDTAG